ncbi:MAG: hypothetical protein KF817_15370 [Phycisphaeraceae bacterium]|nr:hypothetical protein [Phycisphaeraceae bacterium]
MTVHDLHVAIPYGTVAQTAPPAGLAWIEVALLIFFAVFVLIVLRVVLAGRHAFDRQSRIPLDPDDSGAPTDTPPSSRA